MLISSTSFLGGNTPDRVHVVITHVSTLSCEVFRGKSVWKLMSNCNAEKMHKERKKIRIGYK
jgi:hypothetical protein